MTKHRMSEDRPVARLPIAITEKMVMAGLREYWAGKDEDPDEQVVKDIFKAMVEATKG